MSLEEIKFITLTNSGYINYTLNCLESLEKINSSVELHSYCIGKEGYNILKDKGYSCSLINEENNSNFQSFLNGNWNNIMNYKFTIIHENLLKYKYVLYTDGDIVYENSEFYNYLLENIQDNDMLIQNDKHNDEDKGNLCAGFMFIKSNPATIYLFDPNITSQYINTPGWNDQVYINDIKHQLKYKMLPLHLFPNGKYYYENSNLNPYMIHFNWVVGHEKNKKMKFYNKWYIQDMKIEESKQNAQRMSQENAQRMPQRNAQRMPQENAQRMPQENAQRMPQRNARKLPQENAQNARRRG